MNININSYNLEYCFLTMLAILAIIGIGSVLIIMMDNENTIKEENNKQQEQPETAFVKINEFQSEPRDTVLEKVLMQYSLNQDLGVSSSKWQKEARLDESEKSEFITRLLNSIFRTKYNCTIVNYEDEGFRTIVFETGKFLNYRPITHRGEVRPTQNTITALRSIPPIKGGTRII